MREAAWQYSPAGNSAAAVRFAEVRWLMSSHICLPDGSLALVRYLAYGHTKLVKMTLFGGGEIPKKRPDARCGGCFSAPRDDRKPVDPNTQGASGWEVGRSAASQGEGLFAAGGSTERDLPSESDGEYSDLDTGDADRCANGRIAVCFFLKAVGSDGISSGLRTKNVFLRRAQFHRADHEGFCLRFSRQLVAERFAISGLMLHAESCGAARSLVVDR